ncbi:MAG: MFS transporter, partial [Planctomycetaceae bacterium]
VKQYSDPSRSGGLLGLLMAQAAIVHFNRVRISVVGSELFIREGTLTESEMGRVYTAYLVVYTLLMLPGGLLIDRFGPWKALLGMGLGSCLLVPLTGLAGMLPGLALLPSLLLIRSLLGGVTPPMHPGAARAVSMWFPPRQQGLANSLVTGTAVLGVVISPVLFGKLMDLVGWRQAFAVAGAVTAVVTLAWALFARQRSIPQPHSASDPTDHHLASPASGDQRASAPASRSAAPAARDETSPWKLLAHPGLLLLTLGYACYSYYQYLFFYWAENYFLKELKFPTEKARWATSLTLFAMAAGMLLGGVLIDRARRIWRGDWGRIIVPLVGMTLSAVFAILAVAQASEAGSLTCLCLSMGMLGVCEAPFWVTGVDFGRRWGGTTGALLNTIGNAGGLLAPLFTPMIAEKLGWTGALQVAGVICFLGALCWLGVRMEERPRRTEGRGRQP